MAFTAPVYDVNNIQGLADLTQNQATAVKVLFDKTGADIKTFLIAFLAELASVTDGSSGADNVGATAITGLSGATVQALLEALKSHIDTTAANFVLGEVADGSLTDAKLSDTAGQIKSVVTAHLAENASETVKGHVELATAAETTTGTDTTRAVHPAGLKVELNKKSTTATYTATLDTTWSGSSAPFTKTQAVTGVLSTDNPIVDIVMSGTYATDEARLEAWVKIYRITTTNGSITMYATEAPLVDLPIQLKVVR